MRLKTQMIIGSVLSLIIILALMTALFFILERQDEAVAKEQLSMRVITATQQLNALTADYLLHQDDRVKVQWRNRHQSLAKIFLEESTLFPKKDLALLQQRHSKALALFNRSVVVHAGHAVDGAHTDQEVALFTRLQTTIQAMASTAEPFAMGHSREMYSMSLQTRWLAYAIIFLVIVIIGLWGAIAIRILQSLRSLTEDIQLFSEDMNFRLKVNGANEISDLAGSFNMLTDRLQSTLVSREALVAEVDARKRSEISLQEIRNSLLEAQAYAHVGNWELNASTGVTYWSDEIYRIVGVSKDFTPGSESLKKLLHPDDRERVLSSIKEAIIGKNDYYEEYRVLCPNGEEHWVESRAQPFKDTQGHIIGLKGVIQDITRRKQAELEKERLQREIRQSHKMQALGQLTGGIAHDFNNILAITMGFTSMALERFSHEAPEQMVEYLSTAMKASERGKSLVAQMLAFSRADIESEQPQQLKSLVNENIKMMESILPSSIRIEFNCEGDLPNIMMDPTKFQQMLMNICINAKDAMEGVGVLTFSLGWKHNVDAECSSCHKWIDGQWVDLSITDTGCGMTDEVLEHLFEPFFTTKEVGKGTGMGMAVLHGIVKSHGGHLLVETELGKGTTVHLLFPAVAALDRDTSVLDKSLRQLPQGQGHHVLVVDDVPELADYVGELLELHGYQATIRTDSQDALNLFLEVPDKFSLLVTDQTMPGLTGMELVKKIHEVRPGFPVILCSGNSEAINQKSVEGSDIQFLDKPIDAGLLIQSAGNQLGLTVA